MQRSAQIPTGRQIQYHSTAADHCGFCQDFSVDFARKPLQLWRSRGGCNEAVSDGTDVANLQTWSVWHGRLSTFTHQRLALLICVQGDAPNLSRTRGDQGKVRVSKVVGANGRDHLQRVHATHGMDPCGRDVIFQIDLDQLDAAVHVHCHASLLVFLQRCHRRDAARRPLTAQLLALT